MAEFLSDYEQCGLLRKINCKENTVKVENRVAPSEEQMAAFLEEGEDTPIHMVNLLKFKEKAEYEDGRENDLTGAQAYAIYGAEVQAHVKKVGGKGIFSGQVSRLMLGEVEELWDMVAIVMYPSKKAMFTMITDPEYVESAKHRSAGLAGQLNIETKI
jgi:uncharacterized protein (DUF1330 family)